MRDKESYSKSGRLGYISSFEKRENLYQERINEYNKNPNKCLFCGEKLDYKHRHLKFCNHSCSASFNNKKRKKEKKHKEIVKKEKNIKENFCLNCDKPINEKLKFCCLQCLADYNWKIKKEKIEALGFFYPGKYGEADRRTVRRFLIDKYGHECSICHYKKWQGKPIPLVVDHINGNPMDCFISNFRLVCGNCDMQLPTYKNKNKYGRRWRMKRYRENKSY